MKNPKSKTSATPGAVKALNIAIFGDVHGRVLMPFYLVDRWQREHQERIAFALCTGDLGIYRSIDHMEKTSRRWAKKHPEELGFSKFFFQFDPDSALIERHPVVDELIQSADINLYFVPGNHEEHPYLGWIWQEYADSLDRPVAVDMDWQGIFGGKYKEDQFSGYGRILMLPEGPVVSLPGPMNEDTWEPEYEIHLRAVNGLETYTSEKSWGGRLIERVDIMLSHGTYKRRLEGYNASGKRDDYGSERLLELVKRVGPDYHFFGHHHWYYPEAELPNDKGMITRSVGLGQVMFHGRASIITQGSFGILRVRGPGDMTFEIVEDGWIKSLRYAECAAYM